MNQYWYLQEANRKAHLFELELKRMRWQQQAVRSPRLLKRHLARLLNALTYAQSQLRPIITGKDSTLSRRARSSPTRAS